MVAAIGAAASARVAERAALSEDAATRANFDRHLEQPQSPAAPPPPPPAEPDAPQPGHPGLSEQTGEGVNTAIHPADEIAKLNSDGDQVVMSMTGEGKLQLPIPVGDVPLGIGVKSQYGYQITVQQVGDAPAAGETGAPPAYDVAFDKNLLGGGTIEPPVPGIDPAAELNLRTSGSVTMRFATQEDAARAVSILQRLALSESIHDAGSAISTVPDLSNPASNPITDDGSSLPSIPNPLADAIAPSQGDMTFLRDNVISYTSRGGVQERAKVALKFANLGIEPRLDGNQWLTRTVELAHDGQLARLSYTLSGALDPSTKEKFTVGAQELDQLEIGYVPQTIVDHGQLSGEVGISWDVPADAMDTALSGQPAPELDTLLSGESLGAPDRISAQLQLGAGDGVQVRRRRTEKLAPTRRTQPVPQACAWCQVYRRAGSDRHCRPSAQSRRLIHQAVTKISDGAVKSRFRVGLGAVYGSACSLCAIGGRGIFSITGPYLERNAGGYWSDPGPVFFGTTFWRLFRLATYVITLTTASAGRRKISTSLWAYCFCSNCMT